MLQVQQMKVHVGYLACGSHSKLRRSNASQTKTQTQGASRHGEVPEAYGASWQKGKLKETSEIVTLGQKDQIQVQTQPQQLKEDQSTNTDNQSTRKLQNSKFKVCGLDQSIDG